MAAGNDWNHGYIPLTPQSMRQKNHGRPVKPGSWVTNIPGARQSSERGPRLKNMTDSAGKPLHVGDQVHVHSGPHEGKTGHVVGSAGKNRVIVGGSIPGGGAIVHTGHVRHAADHETGQQADKAIRAAARTRRRR